MDPSPNRVISYVDGFNLYFGLREKAWRHYYWLDLWKLSESLLRKGQNLVQVKYCTARISGPGKDSTPERAKRIEASRKRQQIWLEALETMQGISIYEGHYLSKLNTCFKCGNVWEQREEKMTDVQVATQMLIDSFNDNFDTAILVSGDSDLVPPITEIRKHAPDKRVVVAFPPRRRSKALERIAHASFMIGEGKLKKSLLPSEIVKADGHVLRRPKKWNRP